jgi:transitional endoplasmic reticulum ATPase
LKQALEKMVYSSQDPVAIQYARNAEAPRVNTDLLIIKALQEHYPDKEVIVIPEYSCKILDLAKTGQVVIIPDPSSNGTLTGPLQWHGFVSPTSRLSDSQGSISKTILFGKYLVNWNDKEFLMYIVSGRDGTQSYPDITNQYIIASSNSEVDSLILAAGKYGFELHGEIWVYDQGWWQKDARLWQSIQKSLWEDVILDESMKQSLIDEVNRFYDSRPTYERLAVPWKRGLIFHGPPGNGKTISIKATMNMLYQRKESVPTLYVKSLANIQGPERSLNDIFTKARMFAPCYLVFEDLDSLVTDRVRSFFLNQVDGIANNDGILMVGSTNHLERLDPGISKRPSRFDRKYLFPDPDLAQRVQYAEFWRTKILKNNERVAGEAKAEPVEFPKEMCKAVANITDGFSFAYMQEAFLASLLQLAIGSESQRGDIEPANTQFVVVEKEDVDIAISSAGENTAKDDGELDKYVLWREFKKQVEILKDQMGSDDDEKKSSVLPPLEIARPKILAQVVMALPRKPTA